MCQPRKVSRIDIYLTPIWCESAINLSMQIGGVCYLDWAEDSSKAVYTGSSFKPWGVIWTPVIIHLLLSTKPMHNQRRRMANSITVQYCLIKCLIYPLMPSKFSLKIRRNLLCGRKIGAIKHCVFRYLILFADIKFILAVKSEIIDSETSFRSKLSVDYKVTDN